MKKTVFALIFILFIPFICACEKENGLIDYVSEIRSDILCGSGENYAVKAYAVKSEFPKEEDGAAGNLVPHIIFYLDGGNTESLYSLTFNIGEKNYSTDFKTDPATGKLVAEAEAETEIKTLTVCVLCAGNTETIVLSSVVPENAKKAEEILSAVYENNRELFDSYRNSEGKFCAEICLRITVKNEHPYYFFGIYDGKERKVFLADGYSAEVLAVRNIFK